MLDKLTIVGPGRDQWMQIAHEAFGPLMAHPKYNEWYYDHGKFLYKEFPLRNPPQLSLCHLLSPSHIPYKALYLTENVYFILNSPKQIYQVPTTILLTVVCPMDFLEDTELQAKLHKLRMQHTLFRSFEDSNSEKLRTALAHELRRRFAVQPDDMDMDAIINIVTKHQ